MPTREDDDTVSYTRVSAETYMKNALEEIAEDAARDILSDNPEVDVTFETWIELIDGKFLGVIDMGELYGAVFTYDRSDCEWWLTFHDVRDTIDTIITRRRNYGLGVMNG
jgi:hypothetical protein